MKIPPIEEYEFNGKVWKIGYRITTHELKSLGLRKNPNIITYKIDDWTFPVEKKIIEGVSDKGGIWLARTKGSARAYQKYMLKMYNQKTRVFKSLIDKVLFVNNERIKTNKIFMFEELFLLK